MSNEGSLLRLFNSEYFTHEHLFYYLLRKENQGIQSYLINKLYGFPVSLVSFFLPQLVNLLLTKETSTQLATFFLDASIRSHFFAVKLYWLLNAAFEDGNSTEFIEDLLHDLEMVIVNAKLPPKGQSQNSPIPPQLFDIQVNETEMEKYTRKNIRAEYFNYQHKVTSLLCKISVGLNTVPLEARDERLRTWLTGIDNWIQETRNKYQQPVYSEYSKVIFRGVSIPLEFYHNSDSADIQIVKLHPSKSFCFTTKARVPYKLLLETVEITELQSYQNPGSTVGSENTELGQEVQGIDIEAISHMVDKEEARFEGFGEYAEEVHKKEREGTESPPNNSGKSETEGEEDIWSENWEDLCESIRAESGFGSFVSWKLRAVIVKGLDDMRQECLAMQMIKKFKIIFEEAGLSLWLRPYDILIFSHNMGIIEFIPNTLSLHSIKKNSKNYLSLLNFFVNQFQGNFEEAQKNFVESMAGYSLFCYLMNVKDRHNANILLDSEGHIIHIDFGFFLTNSPGGNINFETAPFKLNNEMIELMGGLEGEMFTYFKILLFQGFLELRKHVDELSLFIEMLRPGNNLPCFRDFDRALSDFRDRFHPTLTDEKCMSKVNELVESASDNWRTNKYDAFQRYSNGIL